MRIYKFCQCILLFHYYLPFGWTTLLPFHQRMLWNRPIGFGEDMQILLMYFSYFVIISLLEKAGSFIRANLNPLYVRMLWVKFAWNWFWRRRFELSSIYFLYFVILSPLEKERSSLYLNKLESPSPKFGWNWLSGSGEEDFLISSMYFIYFIIISPWKRVGPFIWTNLNPLHLRMLCAKFGWNCPNGSGEQDENVKSLQTDGQTDTRRTTGGQKSSL